MLTISAANDKHVLHKHRPRIYSLHAHYIDGCGLPTQAIAIFLATASDVRGKITGIEPAFLCLSRN